MILDEYKKLSFISTYRRPLILFLIIVLFLGYCTKKDDQIVQEPLALVNGVPITKKELVRRLELTPLPEFHKLKERNKRALDLLIDELLVSQWAQEQGLGDSSDYQDVLDFVKQQALIRELFFEEIRDHAEPDSQQIHQAVEKSIQRLTVQTLFTEDENIAREWSKSLRSGKTFEDLVKDSKGNHFVRVDSSSFHWGDGTIPIEVEKIAYQLEVGESSDLLELNNGFGIFIITNRVQDIFLTQYDFSSKWQTVKQVLQARTESRLANGYVDRLLTHLNITQRAAGFLEVTRYMEEKLDISPENSHYHPPIFDEEFQLPFDYNLDLPVLETPDFSWTGEDVLNILKKYNFPISTKNSKALRNTLTQFLKVAIRDHYLSERAKQLGLESKERVKEDVQIWGRYFLYLKGVSIFTKDDSILNHPTTVANQISELRTRAQIAINRDLLEKIELTGIPMVVIWNSDITRQLAVPPLMEFR